MSTDPADWYRQAVVYQIYPRSFADSDGDGIGDLPGITAHVDHLARLGVDAVWLSPFYPSALADGGYDVDDHRAVDPRLGTLADFDDLVSALHDRGIRLVVDIVPNHSGSGHALFRRALAAGPGSPERDLYIFRDGRGEDGSQPPTDWRSVFGGSAWQRVDDGQWYLHLFDVSQPDWNWENPAVWQEYDETLTFWADRGVDGFRIDVAQLLRKDLSEPLPSQAELDALDPTEGNSPLGDRDEVHEVYRHWREIFNRYDPPRVAVAEAWVPANRRPAYASAEELGQAFNFDLLQAPFEAQAYRTVVTDNLDLARRSGSSSTWVLSNHDMVRHATRFGLPAGHQDGREHVLTDGRGVVCDAELGRRRARAATMFLLALPGSVYLYQGEELGLPQVLDIPDDQRQDPTFHRSPGWDKGRDGCRVPLPWTEAGPSFGFGPGGSHLPQPSWWGEFSVQAQQEDPDSFLSLYRNALALRREFVGAEELEWLPTPEGVLGFTRPCATDVGQGSQQWVCLFNLTSEPVDLPEGAVLLSSEPLTGTSLPAATTVWMARE